MQMHKINIKGTGNIYICQSCIDGKHLSYGDCHKTGIKDSQDCKNVGEVDGVKIQCLCNFDWPEIIEAIKENIMPKDDSLEKALKYDAVDDAEAETGKGRDDEETQRLGLRNLVEGNIIKKALLVDRQDTWHGIKFEEYTSLIESIGFKKIFEMEYIADCCGSKSDEKMFVYWREGLLLIFTSFTGSLNSSGLYFNWKNNNGNKWPEGGFSGGCIKGDVTIFAGHYDGREALKYNIRRLEETGTILKQWREQPFLWFSNSGDEKPYEEGDKEVGGMQRDYKEINKERMDQLPEEIQKAIKHKGETNEQE